MEEIDHRQPDGAWATLVRGLRLSPEFREGLWLTLLLAGITTAGRVVVPVTVQQVVDRGLRGAGGPDVDVVAQLVVAGAAAIAATSAAGYIMNYRLARATETALSALRVRAFRHIHDLSMLHHATEHRGALVSRVTSDVDTISQFMQWGGVVLLVNLGQLLVAAAVMAYYSWPLTLLVILSFAPLTLILHWFQRRLSSAYDLVRRRVGELMTAIAESVVGAAVIRAYYIQERTDRRIDQAVDREYTAQRRAARLSTTMFSTAEIFSGIATAVVVVVGVRLGVAGDLSEGRLVAFLFLVTLFIGPVQVATEVLNEVQTAIAGWRRILNVLDTEPDVVDPSQRGGAALVIPPGPIGITFEDVVFSYPARDADEAPVVLHPLSLTLRPQASVAIVGETGSGKTTFAKLLTRLMDPTAGRILINGAPLRDVAFESLRNRVVMVPQDGFLFDNSVAVNVRHGHPGLPDDGVRLAFLELGLADWVESLPHGIHTRVGERGEALSVGERQLVALARAYVAGPDLLVLDEATSAVDPATEVRIQRALDGLTRGRTSVAIAHRLSTAEAAEEVLVFDAGRLVQRGTHRELVDQEGPYARLHASWIAGSVGSSR
ncbi:MAG: ATP-binding cassette domain-containing protein [Nitriliruptorales bacterium]|nr:ATP-binding cassette domain-containing protein [Nitriliruptorales bacterium]